MLGQGGEVADEETSNDLVGGAQDKEEETVRRTRSSSKVGHRPHLLSDVAEVGEEDVDAVGQRLQLQQ